MKPVTRIGTVLFISASVLISASATAQLREPIAVPAGVSAQEQADLEQQRASLMTELNSLKARIAAHNQKCSDVPADAPIVGECRAAQDTLRAEIQRYRSHVADYERANEKMVEVRARQQAAQQANINGLNALGRGDYEAAVKHLGEAHDYAPDDRNIQENLERARAALRESRGSAGRN
ncbi:MAG TPA: hypothetical protein VGE12_04795 [Noviherbaspirillum sp.]